MSSDWMDISEELVRSRNLRISIARELAQQNSTLDEVYETTEIMERFSFCKRDIKYKLEEFFEPTKERYILNTKTRSFLQKVLLAHHTALPFLGEAEVVFLKSFGRYCDEFKTNYHNFDYSRFRSIYNGLLDVIPVLHWGLLPILNKYLMINSRRIPEDDVLSFYDNYDMLHAMLKDIRGEGEKMTTKGDETLGQEMTFSVYTRRWQHKDNYRILRTVDGWNVGHKAIRGTCEKDGTGALFMNLEHDSVFYPKDGVKHALSILWEQANEGELTVEELKVKLQQIADWISMVEMAIGKGQPDWVNYY